MFTIDRTVLKQMLEDAKRGISYKSCHLRYRYMSLAVEQDELVVVTNGSDLDMEIRQPLHLEPDAFFAANPAPVIFQPDELLKWVAAITSDKIDIHFTDGSVVFETELSYKRVLHNEFEPLGEDHVYPNVTDDDFIFRISSGDFTNNCHMANLLAADDYVRPALHGLSIQKQLKGLTIMACDGFVLGFQEYDIHVPRDVSFVLDLDVVKTMLPILKQFDDSTWVKFYKTDHVLTIKIGEGHTFTVRLNGGVKPPGSWVKIFDVDNPVTVSCQNTALKRALKIVGTANRQWVKYNHSGTHLILEMGTADSVDTASKVPTKGEGKLPHFATALKTMSRVVAHIYSTDRKAEIELTVSSYQEAIRLKKKGSLTRYVVMPGNLTRNR